MNVDLSFSSDIEDDFAGHQYDGDARFWDGLHQRLKRVKDANGNKLLDSVVKHEKRTKISFMPPPPELVPPKNPRQKDKMPPRAFQNW